MCFNPFITWATAGLAIGTAAFVRAKGKPFNLYFAPAFFGSMEILQGIMYTQLNQPPSFFINLLIYVAYMHVCFQPLVINLWLGAFISEQQKEIYRFTLKLSFVAGLFLLTRMFINQETPLCASYETLCNAQPIIFYGSHHIAWGLPLIGGGFKYITPSIALHMFFFFIPGILLGFYWLMATFFLLGPYLATVITNNPSEASSIWCVIGLWVLLFTVLVSLNKNIKMKGFLPMLLSESGVKIT